jgi:hypothetical protein
MNCVELSARGTPVREYGSLRRICATFEVHRVPTQDPGAERDKPATYADCWRRPATFAGTTPNCRDLQVERARVDAVR